MIRTYSFAAMMALLSLALILPMPAEAQTRDASLQSIRASVTQAIGAEDATVEVSITGNVLTVARVNSSLNQTSHSNRDSEASRIAPIVSKAIADKPEFKNIHTIRVLYLVRSKPDGAAKAIDTVDFRKDPSGVFLFHTT
jgi:sensor domain CHASE-containing protein